MSNGHLGRKVSLIGVGYTPLGNVLTSPEVKDFSERELFSMACIEAMDDAGINAKQIDAYLVGMSGPNYDAKLKSGGTFFADWIGMRNKPMLFHDEGCGTSAFGMTTAVQMVASGVYDCVISAGVNICHSVPKPAYPPHIRSQMDYTSMWDAIWTGVDAAYMRPSYGGTSFLDATIMDYCKKYGYSFQDMEDGQIQYIMDKRKEALLNPKAILCTESFEAEAKKAGFDDVKKYLTNDRFDPYVSRYVRAKFSSLVCDGASAVIVCSSDIAKKISSRKPIEVIGIGSAHFLEKEMKECPIPGEAMMFKNAYAMAGITDPRREIDYMGLHDCPATSALTTAEAAGYYDGGETLRYMLEGKTTFDSDHPFNTSGGRTQAGHCRAPAFNIEVAEAVYQMRGENGDRQMANIPKTTVVAGGGSGVATSCVVLRNE